MKIQIFTKNKFLKLEKKQQHKKCAEILRHIYEAFLSNNDIKDIYHHYNQLLHWIGLESFKSLDLKKISDKYHYHLKFAQINLKEHNLLPSLRSFDKEPKEAFLNHALYLDNIRSAYNVGSIIRTTEALRIGSIYFSNNTPFIDNEKVIKTSMGTSTIVKCYNDFNLNDLPKPFIGLDTSNQSISIYDFIFPDNFTLFLGNEEYGLSQEILNQLDYIIEIPMLGFKNSINVASAYSICASEIKRQKLFKN